MLWRERGRCIHGLLYWMKEKAKAKGSRARSCVTLKGHRGSGSEGVGGYSTSCESCAK